MPIPATVAQHARYQSPAVLAIKEPGANKTNKQCNCACKANPDNRLIIQITRGSIDLLPFFGEDKTDWHFQSAVGTVNRDLNQ